MLCSVQIIRVVIAIATVDGVGPQTVILHMPTFLFLALGGWLCKLGLDIVRGDLNAVGRASQASMVYITVAIIQLVFFMVFGVWGAIALGRMMPMSILAIMVASILIRTILLVPPAFIMYVESVYPSKD